MPVDIRELSIEGRPPVNLPPDPNPRMPRFAVPAGSWDCHFHIIGPPDLFPYSSNRRFNPPAATYEHYCALASFLGFERGVVVQSGAHGADPASMLDAVARSEGRLRGMTLENTLLAGADARKLKAAGVAGVRLNVGHHDPHLPFDRARFDRVIAIATEMSWIVPMHVNPRSLAEIADIVRRIGLPTIIDNFAGLDARKGVDQPELRTVIDLACEPHVWIKMASAYRMMLKGATYEQVVALSRILHAASPDRVIWGSDWPHSNVYVLGQMPNDGDQVDWLLDFVPDEVARRKLLVDNPKRLFDAN